MKTQFWSFQTVKACVAPLAVLGLAAALIAGCNSGDGPSVKTDYDKNVNFAQYHTFAVEPGRLVSRLGTPDTNNTLVAGRIQNAVINQLTAKGLQPVTQNPDLVATYIAGAKTRQDIESMGPDPYNSPYFGGRFGFDRGAYFGAGYNEFYTNTYTQGTLILDLIDPRTKKLVWRAYVSGPVDQPDQKTVSSAVSAALKNFPPPAKGQ